MMESLPPDYFDALYRRDPDPWRFATSPYEAEKYAATIAALPRPRYRAALEVGCSIGVLTGALGDRCDSVLGIDIAAAAIDQARARHADRPHLHFATGAFPAELPRDVPRDGYDLILFSEVLYYLGEAALIDAALVTLGLAARDADILLVHWLGPTPDYPATGDEAAEAFIAALRPDFRLAWQHREADYRIDHLQR